ncbi:hypothetical protein B0J11DRAFT_583277 [Dendryphion nanum]|uniref:TauD/TfdA-like domain-containing protein n=1 Tax=Dendryphion nanum TaxID=256645 RepID=A0A9P9DFN7_9PLEO|nr:hypothetical protein B0J11DRAFT_583277 [Dendryphion nanum]
MARLASRNPTVVEPPISTTQHSIRSRTHRHHGQKPPHQVSAIEQHVTPSALSSEGSLFSSADRTDISDSIGTLLSGIQLSSLTPQQLDDLGSLVAERGVVFFHDQKVSNQDHLRVSEHYGFLSERPSVRRDSGQDVESKTVSRLPDTDDWYVDGYVEEKPSSFSLLKIDADQDVKGETLWVNQYGLYDTLSRPMKRFFDELQTLDPSKLTRHPAVQTHPVTGLKALNVIPGLVSGFADLKKKESDKLLEFVDYHIHSAAEHTIRFKWTAGTVAIWDNRTIAYKNLSGSNLRNTRFLKTSVLGGKPFFDLKSESREERADRVEQEAKEEAERVRQIKARYNRTPLRRIIHRQLFGQEANATTEDHTPDETTSNVPGTESAIVDDSPKKSKIIKDPPQEKNDLTTDRQHEQSYDLVNEMTVEPTIEKKSPVNRFNESPLRRIIRRQVSGNNQRQWHQSNLNDSGYPPPLGYKSQPINAIQAA